MARWDAALRTPPQERRSPNSNPSTPLSCLSLANVYELPMALMRTVAGIVLLRGSKDTRFNKYNGTLGRCALCCELSAYAAGLREASGGFKHSGSKYLTEPIAVRDLCGSKCRRQPGILHTDSSRARRCMHASREGSRSREPRVSANA
jgi:hypothetical protein